MLLLLLVGSAFVVAAAWFVWPTRPIVATLAIAFFGLGVVVAVVGLLPGSSYLELDERGFTLCTLFRKSFQRWDDVAEFFPIRLDGRGSPMVAVRYAPGFTANAAARRFAKTLAGAEGALPDTYGRSAAELAELLNKVRAERSARPPA